MAVAAAAAWILAGLLCAARAAAEGSLQVGGSRRLLQSTPLVANELPNATPLIALCDVCQNGENAACGRFTYMVSLRDKSNTHMCGGVLVHRRWVLTAAHCVDPNDPRSLGPTPIVVVGACRLSDEENVEKSVADDAFIHEDYNGNVTNGYDVALLRLKDDSLHTPASLPSAKAMAPKGGNLVALGWGLNKDQERPDRLQEAFPIQVVSNETCNLTSNWGPIIKDHMVCVFGNNLDTCTGDSGGPLLQVYTDSANLSKGNPELDTCVAITSFGDSKDCGETTLPGVYTSTSHFREWIDEQIENHGPDGGSIMPKGPEVAPAPGPAMSPSLPPALTPEGDDVDLGEKLWTAASGGDADLVRELLDRGADIESVHGRTQSTPLVVAAQGNHLEVARILIEAGADVNAANGFQGVTALYMAAAFDFVELAQLLIDSGADVNRARNGGATALYIASRFGHLEIVRALLDADVEVDVGKAQDDGTTPLMAASRRGFAEVVTALLDGAADPNQSNNASVGPLYLSSLTIGNASVVIANSLLDAGAEIDAADHFGTTPLMAAAIFGNVGTVEVLLARGTDRELTDERGLMAKDMVCLCLMEDGEGPKLQCPEGGCEEEGTAAAIGDLLESGR